MNDAATANPYKAPATQGSQQRTARGYTPGQCLRRFFVIGVIGGAVGGAGTGALNSYAVPTIMQFLPIGIMFGVSLWLAIGAFIDRLSVIRTTVLILGCLAGFAVTAIVYIHMVPTGWFIQQPWTSELFSPYVFGAATGAAVIVATVRTAGGRVPTRVLLMVWIFISLAGFLAFFTVDELGTRNRLIDEPIIAFLCGSGFVAAVLSLVGWQVALANSERDAAE